MESVDRDVVRTSRAPSSFLISQDVQTCNQRSPKKDNTSSRSSTSSSTACLWHNYKPPPAHREWWYLHIVFFISLCICTLYLCIKIFITLIPMAQLQAPAGPQRVMVNKDWICIGFDTVGQTHCAHCISLCICTLPFCICVIVFCFDIVGQTHSMRVTNNSTVTLNLYWLWARQTLHMVQM